MQTHDFISKMDSIMEEQNTHLMVPYLEPSFIEGLVTDLDVFRDKYVELYHFCVKMYKENTLPNYLSKKLELDNLQYSSFVDRFVKYHWVENKAAQFRQIQKNYNKSVSIIKNLFKIISTLDLENTLSLEPFEEATIVPNTIRQIIDSDHTIREAARRGEIKLYYGSIHFTSDFILEESRRIPGLSLT